jgi:hypothetical protein
MKRILIKYLQFVFLPIILIFIIMLFKYDNPFDKMPAYDPNDCGLYSCPVHRDKMNVFLNSCPDYDLEINPYTPNKTLFYKSISTYRDSIFFLQQSIINKMKSLNDLNYSFHNEDKIKLVDESIIILNKAVIIFKKIEKLVFGKRKMVIRSHFKTINQLYSNARLYLEFLRFEILKDYPNYLKIRLYSEMTNRVLLDLNKEQLFFK